LATLPAARAVQYTCAMPKPKPKRSRIDVNSLTTAQAVTLADFFRTLVESGFDSFTADERKLVDAFIAEGDLQAEIDRRNAEYEAKRNA
jgi:hypothetical protein